jgi:hypothetical protein
MIHLLIYSFTSLIIFALCLQLPANCQQSYDPNLGHFYMGRQQITIENNNPIINDRTSSTTGGGGNGGLLNRPAPLPQAGWQPYAPVETPGINPNLPKVPVPVRQSHNAQASTTASGNKGHAGKLTAKTHGKSASPNGIRSYSPYAQYPPPAANTQAAEELGVNTRVKGSLLHWARRTPKQQ